MWIEVILTVALLLIIWNITKKPSDYPPGLWGLPLFGYIFLGKNSFDLENINKLKNKYGKIFCWRIGSKLFVFLYDYQTIKDAFQSVEFADRPRLGFLTVLENDFDSGMTASNGAHWHEIRRFTLRHLRDLGMGKSKIVSAVQHEALEVVESMKKDAGKPMPLSKDVKIAVLNVLWQMVASIRFDFTDKQILDFDDIVMKFFYGLNGVLLGDIFPWLRTILPKSLYDKLAGQNHHLHLTGLLLKYFQVYIDEHKKTIDETDPRDYIDDYLIEMKKQKSNPESTMSDRDLLSCIADLFGAGVLTTSTTIYWAIYYMAAFPEVQKMLQKEVDEVLGKERQATLDDKQRLPYTEAFINETLRYSSLTQFSLPRTVAKDTKLNGYIIPKDSVVMAAEEALHFDGKHFDSPKLFRPERFINESGKLEFPKSGYFPFGTGKRQCIGESLARMELFIFLTTFVQHLEFSVPKGESLNIASKNLPFFNFPKIEQNILVSSRG